jgi:hypothetical protein
MSASTVTRSAAVPPASPYSNIGRAGTATAVSTTSSRGVPSRALVETTDIWRYQAPAPGYGNRHINDDAPFTLWDELRETYKSPSMDQLQMIRQRYEANDVYVVLPVVVIETATPPDPVPLTVAGLFAHFVPLGDMYSPSFRQNLTKGYSDPRMADPHPDHIKPWSAPTVKEMRSVALTLSQFCNVKAVNFLHPDIVVEIENDGRVYPPRCLPAVVAGRVTFYYHGLEDFWGREKGLEDVPRVKQPDTANAVIDDTCYLYQGDGKLCPGVKVSSKRSFVARYAREVSLSTSAGVLIRKGAERRLTLASHGFPTNKVYHPNAGEWDIEIGEIKERFPGDLALAKLHSCFEFTNSRNFEAPSPKRLLTADEISSLWSACDGFSSGVVWLCLRGSRVSKTNVGWDTEGIYDTWGLSERHRAYRVGGDIVDGICGAPIVDPEGGVGGFFHQLTHDGRVAITRTLDNLIKAGWSIV